MGVLGGSVDITWTLTKVDQRDVVVDTRLFLGADFRVDNLLYRGSVVLNKLDQAEKMFGGRIQASFKEPRYILKLSNLSFSDLITLTLVVNQEIGSTFVSRPAIFKSVKIIEVKGMDFIWKLLELETPFDLKQDKIS